MLKLSFIAFLFTLKGLNALSADPLHEIEEAEIRPLEFSLDNLAEEIQVHILSFLNDKDLSNARLLSKKYDTLITQEILKCQSFKDPKILIIPFSSEISFPNIGDKIISFLSRAQSRIVVASDRITSLPLAQRLTSLCQNNPDLRVHVIWGENVIGSVLEEFKKSPQIEFRQVIPSEGRMHNKFYLIDDMGTITGSPNATYKAFNSNIESFVFILDPTINRIFLHYYEYLTCASSEQNSRYLSLRQELSEFNGRRNNPINLWFAPIIHIPNSIINTIKRSEQIDISMFLISRGINPGSDIIRTLLEEARQGATINMRLDSENLKYPLAKKAVLDIQEQKEYFAARRKPLSFNFSAVELKENEAYLHDKLLVILKRHNQEKWVIIGSAGLSTNVQKNINCENMVLIKNSYIYDFFKKHFDAIPGSQKIKQITQF